MVDINILHRTSIGLSGYKNCSHPATAHARGRYTLAHFSRYIRPGAVRIGFENTDPSLMVTAVQNPDGSVAVVILNMNPVSKNINLSLGDRSVEVQISAQAIQTIIVLS